MIVRARVAVQHQRRRYAPGAAIEGDAADLQRLVHDGLATREQDEPTPPKPSVAPAPPAAERLPRVAKAPTRRPPKATLTGAKGKTA